jgi:predicted RNA-binding Zn-ribbon protein involved in translation (DUF1610 family)
MNKRTLSILATGYLLVLLPMWALLVQAYTSQTLMFASAHDRNPFALGILMFAAAIGFLFLFLLIGAAVYVHGDARQRGMNPWLWTAVVVFVPYFIGLVIYLYERKKYQAACPACAGKLTEEAAFCPHCGHALKRQCANCQTLLAEEYLFCPRCGTAVGEGNRKQ